MTRASLKYAACQAAGFQDGDRQHKVAQIALDAGLDFWPNPIETVCEASSYSSFSDKWQRQQRKMREREEKRLHKVMYEAAYTAVAAEPKAYGFVGILSLLFLGLQIASFVNNVVWPLVRLLMDKRWSGGDSEVQQAISARGP